MGRKTGANRSNRSWPWLTVMGEVAEASESATRAPQFACAPAACTSTNLGQLARQKPNTCQMLGNYLREVARRFLLASQTAPRTWKSTFTGMMRSLETGHRAVAVGTGRFARSSRTRCTNKQTRTACLVQWSPAPRACIGTPQSRGRSLCACLSSSNRRWRPLARLRSEKGREQQKNIRPRNRRGAIRPVGESTERKPPLARAVHAWRCCAKRNVPGP